MAYSAKQGADLIIQSLAKLGYPTDGYDTSTANGVDNVFNTVGAFPPSMLNNILEQVNIVLVFNNFKVMFDSSENPTRRFWRDFINYGGGVEDIFHKIIEAEDGYWADDFANLDDDAYKTLSSEIATDLVGFKKEEIIKKFHTDMDKFRIKLSRSDLEIAKVFTPAGFAAYVDVQLANMQTSAEVKLQSLTIAQIKKIVDDKRIVFKSGYNVNNSNGVTTLVEDIKSIYDGMTSNVSTLFNYKGELQKSSKDDVYLVTTPELKERIRTRGYSNAYNLKEYETENRWLTLPYGTDLGEDENGNKVLAMLVDRKTIVMALRYWQMLPFRVNNTDYTNYFLKVMLVKGYNEFFNAVAFTGSDIGNFNDGGSGGHVTISVDMTSSDAVYPFTYFKANGENVAFETITDSESNIIAYYAQVEKEAFLEIGFNYTSLSINKVSLGGEDFINITDRTSFTDNIDMYATDNIHFYSEYEII